MDVLLQQLINGVTLGEGGASILLRLGIATSADRARSHWVMTHELMHLGFPSMRRTHQWIEEGMAVFGEPIVRVRAGMVDTDLLWSEWLEQGALGLPRPGEGGLEQTHTWARTYWGGALYCLQADVAIREQTANRVGLQTALRAILKETGGYGFDGNIGEVLRIGDSATGTHVMYGLYQQVRATPQSPNLDLLWTLLGVPPDPLTQPFDDRAPLAAVRIAITARPSLEAATSVRKD